MMKATLIDAYQLMHEGLLTLAAMEATGMRVDVEYCERQSKRMQRQLDRLEVQLLETDEVRAWKRKEGGRFKLTSGEQLGRVLYDDLGIMVPKYTKHGKPAVDAEALSMIEDEAPFVSTMTKFRRYYNLKNTFLASILREQVGGILRTSYNLHLTDSYRSSSSDPNLQNQPMRDAESAKIIRRAFLAREEDEFLWEADFGTLEVRVAASLTKDPNLLKYMRDPTTDMHRDTAMELFMVKADQITKMVRHAAKNQFVFPQFYGDYFVNCARSLWRTTSKLELADGTPVHDHLRAKGVRDYQDFEEHVEKVERSFWRKRFKGYTAWKEEVWQRYLKHCHVPLVTGFRCGGVMRRNQVLNRPVQGPAFHALLKSITELHRRFREYRMRTRLVMQIHDSNIGSSPPKEKDNVKEMLVDVMTKWLPREWPWLIVPMEIEFEAAPVGGSWYDKKKEELPT